MFRIIQSNSFFAGLISDSFHMFFDCSGLMAGLVASVITKWRATDKYSYGYGKTEVLAGFANSLLLLFISFLIFAEAVERLIEPPEVSVSHANRSGRFGRAEIALTNHNGLLLCGFAGARPRAFVCGVGAGLHRKLDRHLCIRPCAFARRRQPWAFARRRQPRP